MNRKPVPDSEIKRRAPSTFAVLEFCRAEVAAGRPFPGRGAISQHFKWSGKSPASDALSRLVRFGKIFRNRDGQVYRYSLAMGDDE